MQRIKDYSLYLIITEEYGNGRSALEIAKAAVKGGVDIIQMREKNKSRAELIELGKKLSNLCRDSGVMFIANDDPEIAKETGADGVHLGQEDIKKHSIGAARKILGRGKAIGISTHSIETFKKACAEDVGKIMAMTKKPVFFIGGINLKNVDILLEKGARNISLIRAIAKADDVASAAGSFRKKLDDAKEGACE